MAEYTPLKYYFDKRLAVKLNSLISEVYPAFPGAHFINNISAAVEDKALKERGGYYCGCIIPCAA